MNTLIISEFFRGSSGFLSSKRLNGTFLIVQGGIMKMILFCYSLGHVTLTPFDKLDTCCDTIMFLGAGLLGLGLAEKTNPKTETTK